MKFKKINDVTCNSKVRRHDCHSDVATINKVENRHCLFVFGWIKLKFGVRGHFRLLVSNINSKTQYQFEILRKYHFSSWFLNGTHSWISYHGNNEWNIFNLLISKDTIEDCLNTTKIWWKSVEVFLRYSEKTLENPVAFWCRHEINMKMILSKSFVNL